MRKLIPLFLCFATGTQAELSAMYTSDIASVIDGGLKRGTAYLDNVELNANGTSSQGEWNGTLLYTNNNTFSDMYSGDGQVASNIDNTSMIRIYELWYRHDLEQQSWQLGLIDLNGVYDAIDTAGLFLNSSHGIGPDYSQSGANGPSIFPVTSLAVNWQWQVNDDLHWQVGVFDGVPGDPSNSHANTISLGGNDGALITSELNLQQNDLRYAVGAWRYTASSEFSDGSGSAKNDGLYAIVEHAAGEHDNAMGWWLRAGLADRDINAVENYVGAGVTLQNVNADRPDDVIGVAIAYAGSADRWRANEGAGGAETALELTYSTQVTDWLRLQPDLQYVISPSADNGIKNVVIFILRVEIDLMAF